MNAIGFRRVLICSAIAIALVVAPAAFGDGGELLTSSYPTTLPPDVQATPALMGLPVDAFNVDFVDIGDFTSEAGHPMSGWGDPVGQDFPGSGNWGSEGNCRVLWEPPTPDDPLRSATIDMDFGTITGTKYIAVRWLDGGSGYDGFELTVAGVPGTYVIDEPILRPEVWIDIGVWDVGTITGVHTVTMTATAPSPWSGFATYGQVGMSEIATFSRPDFVPTVSGWGLIVMALIGFTVVTISYGRRRAAA